MNSKISGAQLKTIPLERINRYDKRFSITFPVQIESLVNSFRAVGQLYPVIVKQEGELFVVIDGFRRLGAAVALDFQEIEVSLLPDSLNTTLDYYLLHLYTIITTRSLTEIEKAEVLNKLRLEYTIPAGEIKKQYCPLINFTLFPHYQEICKIVAGLPNELKMYLHKKNVLLQNLVNFWNMANDAIIEVLTIAGILQLGGNKVKILSALLNEIAFREQSSIIDIINRNEIQEILRYNQMSITQKWDHLYNYIYRIRFPGWSQIEDKLQREIVKMELSDKIKLSYPEYLEGDELQFHVHFSSPEELKSVGEKILKISNSEAIRSILQLIK